MEQSGQYFSFKDYLTEAKGTFTAYHGSGANFDKFERTKAHAGAGGAAFGSGIYISKDEKIAKHYKKISKSKNATLYKIKVAIDTDRLMRWDKPFSSQPRPVQQALMEIGYDESKGSEARYFYHYLRSSFGGGSAKASEQASQFLEKNGIQGIMFIGDRKVNDGKSKNFVIFDPKRIRILEKS